MQDNQDALTPPVPPVALAAASPQPAAAPVAAAGLRLPGWLALLLVLLAGAALAASLLLWQRLGQLQTDVAQRSAQSNTQSIEARTLSQQAQTLALDHAARLGVLENQVKDLGLQRTQLENLLGQITRAQDGNLVVEVNAAIRLAQQQTELTGSTEPLLAALRRARARLDQASVPQLGGLQRAIAADIDRLQSAETVDAAGILLRLDKLLSQIDDMPLRNAVSEGRQPAAPAAAGGAATDPSVPSWSQWWRAAWSDLRQLIRVTRIDRPESALIAPDQAFFLRENIKLRLLQVRADLAARQYAQVRAELTSVADTIGRYFDPNARLTQQVATALGQIQVDVRDVRLPVIDETLTALSAASQP
ncbi:MAG: uroporphyrinogen-III C-methyltransferase [Comamonas sp.]